MVFYLFIFDYYNPNIIKWKIRKQLALNIIQKIFKLKTKRIGKLVTGDFYETIRI